MIQQGARDAHEVVCFRLAGADEPCPSEAPGGDLRAFCMASRFREERTEERQLNKTTC